MLSNSGSKVSCSIGMVQMKWKPSIPGDINVKVFADTQKL